MLSGGNQTNGNYSQKISDPLPTLQITFNIAEAPFNFIYI